MAVEVARDLPVKEVEIETPLEPTGGRACATRWRSCPSCAPAWAWSRGSCACCRTPGSATSASTATRRTHVPIDYYERLPPRLPDARVYVLDPMLATGGSAVTALNHLKRAGAEQLELVCLVAAPEGIEAVEAAHPDVRIWTAAVDRELDENAYIRPGLGDAGDRVFGTA